MRERMRGNKRDSENIKRRKSGYFFTFVRTLFIIISYILAQCPCFTFTLSLLIFHFQVITV